MRYLAKREGRQTFNILVVTVGLTNDIYLKKALFSIVSV